jgi:hypothetical protein
MTDAVRADLIQPRAALMAMAIAVSSVAYSPIVSAHPANPVARQTFQPCDWVTRQEAMLPGSSAVDADTGLANGSRIYRPTAAYEYCDTVGHFARTALDRIPG